MTRCSAKPYRRIVQTGSGEMVAELRDRVLTIRPLRSRAGGPAEVSITWGAVYLRCMVARVDANRRAKRKGVR